VGKAILSSMSSQRCICPNIAPSCNLVEGQR
jgi:hypothetical protein